MFNKENRYITNGVRRELPIEVILLIYNEIDELISSKKELEVMSKENQKKLLNWNKVKQ